jgi:hypothetical protein
MVVSWRNNYWQLRQSIAQTEAAVAKRRTHQHHWPPTFNATSLCSAARARQSVYRPCCVSMRAAPEALTVVAGCRRNSTGRGPEICLYLEKISQINLWRASCGLFLL